MATTRGDYTETSAAGMGIAERQGRRDSQEDAVATGLIDGFESLTNEQQSLALTNLIDVLHASAAKSDFGKKQGATCCGAVIMGDEVRVANVADARCFVVVIDENGNVQRCDRVNKQLHSLKESAEQQRIAAAIGEEDTKNVVQRNRLPSKEAYDALKTHPLAGGLNLARSIGNTGHDGMGFAHHADVSSTKVAMQPGWKAFVITTCDGVVERTGWNAENEGQKLKEWFQTNKANLKNAREEQIAALLVDSALAAGSKDNVTAIVTKVDPNEKRPKYQFVLDGHGGSKIAEAAAKEIATAFPQAVQNARMMAGASMQQASRPAPPSHEQTVKNPQPPPARQSAPTPSPSYEQTVTSTTTWQSVRLSTPQQQSAKPLAAQSPLPSTVSKIPVNAEGCLQLSQDQMQAIQNYLFRKLNVATVPEVHINAGAGVYHVTFTIGNNPMGIVCNEAKLESILAPPKQQRVTNPQPPTATLSSAKPLAAQSPLPSTVSKIPVNDQGVLQLTTAQKEAIRDYLNKNNAGRLGTKENYEISKMSEDQYLARFDFKGGQHYKISAADLNSILAGSKKEAESRSQIMSAPPQPKYHACKGDAKVQEYQHLILAKILAIVSNDNAWKKAAGEEPPPGGVKSIKGFLDNYAANKNSTDPGKLLEQIKKNVSAFPPNKKRLKLATKLYEALTAPKIDMKKLDKLQAGLEKLAPSVNAKSSLACR